MHHLKNRMCVSSKVEMPPRMNVRVRIGARGEVRVRVEMARRMNVSFILSIIRVINFLLFIMSRAQINAR